MTPDPGEDSTQTFDQRAGQMFDPAAVKAALDGANEADPTQGPPSQRRGAGHNDDPEFLEVKQALHDAIDESKAKGKEGETLIAGQRANTMRGVDVLERGRQDIAGTQVPQLGKAPQEPTGEIGADTRAYITAIAGLAGLMGGLGRASSTAALTAIGGVYEGLQQGNKQKFDQELASWKAANDRMKEDNQAKLDQYNLILGNKKLSMDMKLAQVKMVATQYNDEIAYNAAEQKQPLAIAQLIQNQYKMGQTADAAAERMWATGQRVQDLHGQIEDRKQGAKDLVDKIAKGEVPPNYPVPAAMKPYFAQELKKRPDLNLSKLTLEYRAADRQVASINSANMLKYAGVAKSVVNTIDDVVYYANQLKQGGIPLVNHAELMGQIGINTNSPEGQLVLKYISSINTLKEEFAQLAQGGGVPTEPAWALANQQINAAYGNEGTVANLGELQRLINFRISAIPGLTERGGPLGPNQYTGAQGDPTIGAKPPPLGGGGAGQPQEGERRQFKQGWGVFRNGQWTPENAQ